jgi:hypothetical protein
VRRWLRHLDVLERWLAGVLIGLVAIIGIHLVPLMLAVLTRGTVIATAALAAGGVFLLARRGEPAGAADTHDAESPRPAAPKSSRLSWGIASVAVGAWTIAFVAACREWAPQTLIGLDTQTFHLPNIARWIQSGSMWQIDQFVPLQAHGYYPNSGDVLQLATILPWHSDFFARAPMIALLAVFPIAVYAVGREIGAPPAASAVAAMVPAAVPALGISVITRALPDVVLCFAGTMCVLFLLRHARTRRRSDLVLAGLGLGMALGTKWYGLTTTVITLAVAGAVWWLAARRTDGKPLRVAIDLGILGGVTLVVGGIWMLRNLVEVGNPAFPLKFAPLGITILDAPRDTIAEQVGFSIFHYIGDPGVLFGKLPAEIKQGLGWAPVVLALALALAAWSGWRHRPEDKRPLLLVLVAVLLTGAYLVTPFTALGLEGEPVLADVNTRYLLPALFVAAPVAAWLVPRLRRTGVLLEAAMAAVSLMSLATAFDPLSVRRMVTAGIALAAAGAVLYALYRLWPRLNVTPRRALVAASTVLLVGGGLAYGWRTQDRINSIRYASDGEPSIVALSQATQQRPMRVSIAGDWNGNGTAPVWPAFGPRLESTVSVVGYFDRGFLTNYSDPARFRQAVEAQRPDLLVVGRGLAPRPDVVPREETWAIEAGWRPIARSHRLVVLEPPAGAQLSQTR